MMLGVITQLVVGEVKSANSYKTPILSIRHWFLTHTVHALLFIFVVLITNATVSPS